MARRNPVKKGDRVVTVKCPRCDGAGFSSGWVPDAGRCYLCHGKQQLEVNIDLTERHLYVLRKQWLEAANLGYKDRADRIAEKGKLKRALLDLAKAEEAYDYRDEHLDNRRSDMEHDVGAIESGY